MKATAKMESHTPLRVEGRNDGSDHHQFMISENGLKITCLYDSYIIYDNSSQLFSLLRNTRKINTQRNERKQQVRKTT